MLQNLTGWHALLILAVVVLIRRILVGVAALDTLDRAEAVGELGLGGIG